MITIRMPEHDISTLIALATRFLHGMQLDDGVFCLERVRGHAAPRGRSLRYSLMTHLGLSRAQSAGYEHAFDLEGIWAALIRELGSEELQPGDFGLYLWADAVHEQQHETETLLGRAERTLAQVGGTAGLEGQEVSWLVIGLARNPEARGTTAGRTLLRGALDDLLARQEPATGLLYHYGRPHKRRRFANFATQIYGVLALSAAAREGLGDGALEAARRTADALLGLQLSDGGWPWLYDAARGTVVEPYEIYSVHQHAMAPMALLELGEAGGNGRYVDAAVRGLEWIHGQNELGLEMVDEHEQLIYRSVRRKSPFARAALYASTSTALAVGRGLGLPKKPVELNPTCRPYELGWLLEAWSGREELAG